MQYSKEELEEKLKELLRDEIGQLGFETWFASLKIKTIENNIITFITPSEYYKDWIETRFKELILNALRHLTNINWVFKIVDKKSMGNVGSNHIENLNNDENEQTSISNKATLNPKYTFDTFVVGNNNRFAHAAALSVGNQPAQSYNPLFLYGGVGLGKTHLMHAIGNKILENNPNANVLYVTSEKFTNQLINSIKDNKTELFKTKYRNIDALLIDDIQFIAGKNSAQEEFFHTFNALKENGKQIIISSDKPPKDIPLLEERLISRFQWGLLTDISCPDFETRFAILRKKAQSENIAIDDSILSDIATKIDSNIRELEGVFNKIVARASLIHSSISIELAENIINEFQYESQKVISCDFIQETVSKYFSIEKAELFGNKRSSEIAFPRQIAMYLCRKVINMSFPQIGEEFGGKDHSTVIHACKKIENEVRTKANVQIIVESVENIILNGKEE